MKLFNWLFKSNDEVIREKESKYKKYEECIGKLENKIEKLEEENKTQKVKK